MKLENKRALAARSLAIGKARVIFNTARLAEIKEAITKQDIKDLKESGAIAIREKKGRRTIVKRKTRRRAGSIKVKVKTKKQDYVKRTRKLRTHVAHLKKTKKVTLEQSKELRKQIRASEFRSLSHMKERVATINEKKVGGVKKHAKNTKKKKKRS